VFLPISKNLSVCKIKLRLVIYFYFIFMFGESLRLLTDSDTLVFQTAALGQAPSQCPFGQ
jgi:hypothetical protein